MADELYIGIDLGTTSVKAGLFDGAGRAVATASREIQLDTPAPGFVEFDADEYIGLAFDAIREVLEAGDASAVRAIGLSSQGQTFVALDAEGRPVRPAVSWLDVRASAEAEELTAVSQSAGGGAISAIASCPKILWLRRHEPEVMARAWMIQLIPDYLIFRLTGRPATDTVTAGSTGAFDRWNFCWLDDVLAASELNMAMMPFVLKPGEAAGPLTPEAAAELGLPSDVVVVVGTNDQYAGALGAGNVDPGCGSLALGTALALVVTSPKRREVPGDEGVSPHPAATADAELFALLAYAKTSGVVVRWFRDQIAPELSYDQLFDEIASVPIGADGVSCIPHFSGTGTPDFNPEVRGAFVGLTLSHTRAHLARALAESLAFTVRQNIELLGEVVEINEVRAIGGGARSDVWLQMIADVTGVPIARPQERESACLGAAVLAMVGSGRHESVADAARAVYHPERQFEPDAGVRADYDAAFDRYVALCDALYSKE
jgi:xylulokinase